MYNRYLPRDQGDYIPFSPPPENFSRTNESKAGQNAVSSLFRSLLSRLKIEQMDKGDLLLAAVLLLLYLDSKEDEYLFALALFFLL